MSSHSKSVCCEKVQLQMLLFNGKWIHLKLYLLIFYSLPKTHYLCIVRIDPSSRITDLEPSIGQYNDNIPYTKGRKIFLNWKETKLFFLGGEFDYHNFK